MDDIPPETLAFIGANIRSIETVDVLALVHGEPQREWRAGDIQEKIQSNVASVGEKLEELATLGVLRKQPGTPPTFAFAPATPDLERRITAVVEAYRLRPVTVMQLIYADPLRLFSAAFKFPGKS